MDGKLAKIEEDLKNRLSKYIGHQIEMVAEMVGLNAELMGGKSTTVSVVNKMLKESGMELIHYKSLLKRDDIIFKTVRLKKNHIPAESMSFEKIDFIQLVNETWTQSYIKNKFAKTVVCFIVFKEINEKLIFIGIKFWKMPNEILNNEVKQFWLNLKNVVNDGVELIPVKRGGKIVTLNNLPGSKENRVMHVRPKAKDSNDKEVLPSGSMITKQAYWFNASFVAEILNDMPAVEKNMEEIKKSSKIDINLLQSLLTKEIYAIDDIVEKLKVKIPWITEFDINTESLKSTKYQINPPFIHKKSIKNIDSYIDKILFSNSYINIKDDDFFQIAYVKRKIANYENAFKLIKVEPEIYITSIALEQAGVKKRDLEGYIKAVERFKKTNEFFTINSIRAEGFTHKIDEFDFESIFYESLLKSPNRLQSIKINKQTIFVKSKSKQTLAQILKPLMRERNYLTTDDFIDYLSNNLRIGLDYDTTKKILKNSGFYFSEELDRLFKSKNTFLNYLYDTEKEKV